MTKKQEIIKEPELPKSNNLKYAVIVGAIGIMSVAIVLVTRPETDITILTVLITFVTLVITQIMSMISSRESREASHEAKLEAHAAKVQAVETHLKVNSRMDTLLEIAERAAKAAGFEAGRLAADKRTDQLSEYASATGSKLDQVLSDTAKLRAWTEVEAEKKERDRLKKHS